jgi:hypothetical protein
VHSLRRISPKHYHTPPPEPPEPPRADRRSKHPATSEGWVRSLGRHADRVQESLARLAADFQLWRVGVLTRDAAALCVLLQEYLRRIAPDNQGDEEGE